MTTTPKDKIKEPPGGKFGSLGPPPPLNIPTDPWEVEFEPRSGTQRTQQLVTSPLTQEESPNNKKNQSRQNGESETAIITEFQSGQNGESGITPSDNIQTGQIDQSENTEKQLKNSSENQSSQIDQSETAENKHFQSGQIDQTEKNVGFFPLHEAESHRLRKRLGLALYAFFQWATQRAYAYDTLFRKRRDGIFRLTYPDMADETGSSAKTCQRFMEELKDEKLISLLEENKKLGNLYAVSSVLLSRQNQSGQNDQTKKAKNKSSESGQIDQSDKNRKKEAENKGFQSGQNDQSGNLEEQKNGQNQVSLVKLTSQSGQNDQTTFSIYSIISLSLSERDRVLQKLSPADQQAFFEMKTYFDGIRAPKKKTAEKVSLKEIVDNNHDLSAQELWMCIRDAMTSLTPSGQQVSSPISWLSGGHLDNALIDKIRKRIRERAANPTAPELPDLQPERSSDEVRAQAMTDIFKILGGRKKKARDA